MAHSEVWKFPVEWRKKAQLAAIRMSELRESYCPFMREQGNSAEINLCWEHWQIWWVAERVHGNKKVFWALEALIEAAVLWYSVSSHRADKTLDKECWECCMRDGKARHCLLQLSLKEFSLPQQCCFFLPSSMRNHWVPCDKQGNKGVGGEGRRIILLQHFNTSSYTCHRTKRPKPTSDTKVGNALSKIQSNITTLCDGDSNCTQLPKAHLCVLVVLNRSNKPLPGPGALRWWVKTGWILAGRLFTLPGSLGEDFVLTFVCVTECSWKIIIFLEG